MCPNHIQVMKEIETEKENTNVYTQNTLIQTHLHVDSFTYIILRQNIRVCLFVRVLVHSLYRLVLLLKRFIVFL